MQEIRVRSLGWEDPLEKGTAAYYSILAWRIPWTEEPGGLQSMGSQSQTQLSDHHCHFHTYENEDLHTHTYRSSSSLTSILTVLQVPSTVACDFWVSFLLSSKTQVWAQSPRILGVEESVKAFPSSAFPTEYSRKPT